MGKKAKIIIVILSMLVIGLLSFIVVDKFVLNRDDDDNSMSSSKSNKNSVNNTANSIDNTIDNGEKNEIKETPTKVSPKQAEEVRKALKDNEWLKKNVLVQADENYNDNADEIGTQVVDFIVCKSSDDIPIVVIQVAAEDIRYSKIVLVTYSSSEGKVIAKKINEGHIYHGAYTVDANKCVVNSLYMHGGSEAMVYHSVANGELKFIGEYGSNSEYENNEEVIKYFVHRTSMYGEPEYVSETEYENYKASLNESQYNFVEIGTELNDANVDKYIK